MKTFSAAEKKCCPSATQRVIYQPRVKYIIYSRWPPPFVLQTYNDMNERFLPYSCPSLAYWVSLARTDTSKFAPPFVTPLCSTIYLYMPEWATAPTRTDALDVYTTNLYRYITTSSLWCQRNFYHFTHSSTSYHSIQLQFNPRFHFS